LQLLLVAPFGARNAKPCDSCRFLGKLRLQISGFITLRLWHLYCSVPEWRISFSLLCARDGMRRHELEMKKLVRDLVVVAMLGIFSIAAFAQKGQDKDKRPPKETVRVVDKKDNNRPPPQNNNQPKHNDKKKP
jgi:predicted small lipoprotein YifL